MRAGNLRNKAEIQEIGVTQNEYGEVVKGDYTKLKDVWCSIIPISGKESFLANTDYSKTSHKIRIRYTSGINASQRLVWRGRIFNFLGTMNVSERDKTIDIKAEEVNNG